MKVLCRCGEFFQTSGPIPNPHEWKVLSDELFTELFESFEEGVEVGTVYLAGASMFECSFCGRLWVYWDGMEHAPTSYRLETEGGGPRGTSSPRQ